MLSVFVRISFHFHLVPVCPLPPIPSHAVIRKPRSQYLEGDGVFYDCRPGYRPLAGLGINRCLQGTWKEVTLKCAGKRVH